MTYPMRPLGEVLEKALDPVAVSPTAQYDVIGIYSYGRGIIKRPTIDGSQTNYRALNRIKAGQFIYSKLFGWEGALAVVREEHDGLYASPEFPTFNLKINEVEFRYLAYLAQWPTLHRALQDRTTGMGSRRQRVNVDQLLAAKVPLPDPDEQKRVASKLDSGFTKLNTASLARHDQARKCAVLRDILLRQPSDTVLLGDVVTPQSDAVRVDPTQTYPTVGIRSYGRGTFKRPPALGADTSYKTLNCIKAGQFIYSKLFAWEGALAIVPQDHDRHYASSEFPTFALDTERVDARYFAHLVRWPRLHESLKDETTGMGSRRQRVNPSRLVTVTIPLPPLPEQRRVAGMLGAVDLIPTPRELAKTDPYLPLRISLLDAAFSGRL